MCISGPGRGDFSNFNNRGRKVGGGGGADYSSSTSFAFRKGDW